MVKAKDNSTVKALGRRKTSAARVRLSVGKGVITVNNKDLKEYFNLALWQQKVLSPLSAVGRDKNLDVSVRVVGGGVTGQVEAIRHGIARALVAWDKDLRPVLKARGFLTRDPRAKERKKVGLYKARRAHQWRKR